MTEAEYQAFQSLETDILSRLETAASRHQPPESDTLKEVVALHKRWLSMVWKSYTAEAHKALAGLYVSDSRFQNYYDRNIPGCAELLEQAVRIWADRL